MHRLVHIAVVTLMLAGVGEGAAAATWRLPQPTGETITLTITNTVIHIVSREGRIEIPVTQVQSLRITTRYLDPFEKWESWQREGHDRRGPSPALNAIADTDSEGMILLLGAGALGVAGVASVVDPEASSTSPGGTEMCRARRASGPDSSRHSSSDRLRDARFAN